MAIAKEIALNQPITIAAAAASITFGYDPLGRCVKRVTNSGVTSYLYYDSESFREQGVWDLIQEGTSATSVDRIYVHGNRVDEIVADQAGGVWSYHHYDARGHCILLTDASGNLVEQYSYDAFGKVYYYDGAGNALTDTARGNRFLFTGREWLSTLRLYDFRNRHYLPELGRFIQPDPKEFEAGDYNLYRYCHNDPINKSDPTGLVELSRGVAMLYYVDGELSSGDFKEGIDRGNKAKISNALSKGDISLAQVTAFAASSQGQKVLDSKTFDRFTAEGCRIRDTLLRAAANDREHPGYWEYSAEAIQNDRDANQVRALEPTPGVEGVDGYPFGSKIHREQVPDGWHLIGHIYTQKHPVPRDLLARDRGIFQKEQIAGMAVFPGGRGWEHYNPPIGE